jgi:hypothetical protein
MLRKLERSSLALGLGLLLGASAVWACQGTSRAPTCSRTIYLAKFCPGNVVVPLSGTFRVPIGVLPFVSWSRVPGCAQPESATLTLTLECVPAVGGPIQEFSQTFALSRPVVPGAQTPSSPPALTLPASAFPPDSLPQFCTVRGTYTVRFGSGAGGGDLSGSGDTQVCLVPPAPGNPTVPRLDIRYLSLDGTSFPTCRRGDQAILYYRVMNNDPDSTVDLNLFSEGHQTAVLPDGFTTANAYAAAVYSISAPQPGTDTYAAQFSDEIAPCELLPEGDPSVPDSQPLSRTITIPPLGATVVPISIRSHGMCANGSCNERTVRVEGSFSDGSAALGCAGSALLVNSVRAKSPLCEFSDQIRVNPLSKAIFSEAAFRDTFGQLQHSMTFSFGNLPPPQAGFQLSGFQSQPRDAFPPSAADSVRMTPGPDTVVYRVQQSPGGQKTGILVVQVEIVRLDLVSTKPVSLPLIQPVPFRQSFFDVFYNVSTDGLQVFDRQRTQPLFQGTLARFLQTPPRNLTADRQTFRTFGKTGDLNALCFGTTPVALSRLLPRDQVPLTVDRVFVVPSHTFIGPPIPWSARIIGAGAHLRSFNGLVSQPIEVIYDLRLAKPVPETNIAILSIQLPGAINNPVRVPVVLRVF